MKQIDIKKPKYIIPILILPFILGIGWLVKDMINSAPAEETTLVETEELNLDIPDANLEKREIKSKFESLKGAFNKSSDYSSIQTIDKEEEVSEIESSGSLYSNDEIRQIDSLNQASRIREKELEQQIKGFPTIDESSQIETRKAPVSSLFSKGRKLLKSSAVPPSLIDADASTLSCDTAPKCPSLFRTAASHQPTALCKCSADTPLLHRSND